MGGLEIPWPDDMDARLRAETLSPWVEAQVEALEGVELKAVDCDEYPCMALVHYDPDLPMSTDGVTPLVDRFRAEVEGAVVWTSIRSNQDGAWATMSFVRVGANDDPSLEKRIELRNDGLLAEWRE